MQTIEISDDTYRRLRKAARGSDPDAVARMADRKLRREMNWAAVDRVKAGTAEHNQDELMRVIDSEVEADRAERRGAGPDADRD